MDKNFCQQIDQESLVEQYVSGRLRGDLLDQFEQHLKECEDHARALLLEKALKRGVTDFARGEIKSKLRNRLKKRDDTRFMLLRYAAVLLVAVITPLLIYYQFNVAPEEMANSLSEREKTGIGEEKIEIQDEDLLIKEKPPKSELRARSSGSGITEKKTVEPEADNGAAYNKPKESTNKPEQVRRLEIDKKQDMKSRDLQEMLKTVKASSPPKIEAEHPEEEELNVLNDQAPALATQSDGQEEPSIELSREINKKIEEDSLAIRGCIDNFLDVSERNKFALELSIQVLNNGKIGEIKIIKTTDQSSDLESCIYNILRSWTFSDDHGEGTVVQQITY